MKALAGKFIAFEGIDGAGKTTTAQALAKRLARTSSNRVVFLQKRATEGVSVHLTEHLQKLQDALWEYPKGQPMYELGDRHWLHLMASWFAAFESCQIEPRTRDGETVLVDNWCYKFLARFSTKEEEVYRDARMSFSTIQSPDLVIWLDLAPSEAARRKGVISDTEAGRWDGCGGPARETFIEYQSRVRAALESYAAESSDRWVRLESTGKSKGAVVKEAERAIIQWCASRS